MFFLQVLFLAFSVSCCIAQIKIIVIICPSIRYSHFSIFSTRITKYRRQMILHVYTLWVLQHHHPICICHSSVLGDPNVTNFTSQVERLLKDNLKKL